MNNDILNQDIPQISARYNNYGTNDDKKAEEELIKSMNIPPRDENVYPMPNKDDIEAAGGFLWKMNLLASSYDQNMQALIWDLYVNMDRFIKADTEDVDKEKVLGLQTLVSLNRLKLYIKESDNPIFKDNSK